MNGPSSLNGASGLRHSAIERRADETLHDFLSRRHDAMGAELINLRALVVTQEFALADERRATRRCLVVLIGSEALIATIATSVCWLTIPGNLPEILLTIAASSAIGGGLIVRYAPSFGRICDRIRAWRRR